jgi:phosphoglycerate dehydrogenase-like enzyme
MTLKVYIPLPRGSELEPLLAAGLASEVEVAFGETLPAPAEFEVLVAGVPTREQVEASSRLRMVIIPWAGLPRATRELMAAYPAVAVHNIHHNAAPTAETALALLLAAAKKIVPVDRDFRRDDWRRRWEGSGEILLAGKTALILGLGAVGSRLARVCAALDMTVLGVRRGGSPPGRTVHDPVAPFARGRSSDGVRAGDPFPGSVEIHGPEELSELLPRADALLICVPLTAETRGMIGAAELARLPDHAVLVNVARAEIVDETALYEALRAGWLGGAGLDVWYAYPKDEASRAGTAPSVHPFRELDNVVMSPHRGGHSDETQRLRARHLARLLNAAARGEPLPARVDLARGY